MPEKPFNTFVSDVKLVGKQMGLAAKIAKLKVEIATQKGEKERHFKTIGVKIYAIFSKDRNQDGKVIGDEIANELSLIDRIDKHIDELQHGIAKLQAQFRGKPAPDTVDADEVTEALDDSSRKDTER